MSKNMIEVHRINNVSIFQEEYAFDGFYVSPFDIDEVEPSTLKEIKDWCQKNIKAYNAADVFGHLAYHFDTQFLELEDLDLIIDTFAGTTIAEKAKEEKAWFLSGKPRTKPEKIGKGKQSGFVYLVEGEGIFKIGKTTQLDTRMKFFEIKLPFEPQLVCAIPTDDISQLEKQLHDQFAGKHVNGEWFKLSQQDVQLIKNLADRGAA